MAESRLDLKKSARDKSLALLGPALAGATDLMLSTKEAHWNVKGPTFIALHELFDKLNGSMAGWVDDLAERMVQLGGHAHGTLKAAAKTSPLPTYPEGLTREKDHLKALAAQTAALGALLRKGIDAAAEAGDADTADLFTELSRGLDKQLWFLEAHL
jgi:starvation-inducible DNA-binding protein